MALANAASGVLCGSESGTDVVTSGLDGVSTRDATCFAHGENAGFDGIAILSGELANTPRLNAGVLATSIGCDCEAEGIEDCRAGEVVWWAE